jgi:MFS family permease
MSITERAHAARERQHDEFGGTNWGAAFFGWLVAVGLGALLTALLSAAGAAIALSEFEGVGGARSEAETISLVGGIALLAIALVAYFAGGYVAGRMSRFDGGRQGLAVWIWSIAIAIVLAILGAVAGEEYNVFAALELPRIPIDEGDLTTGGLIALAAIVIGTALAATAGGKAGERYHRRVDRAGYERPRDPDDHSGVRDEDARERSAAERARAAEHRHEQRDPHPAA